VVDAQDTHVGPAPPSSLDDHLGGAAVRFFQAGAG
jgi:hypothetical protein